MELEKLVSQVMEKVLQQINRPKQGLNTLILAKKKDVTDPLLLEEINRGGHLYFLDDDHKDLKFSKYILPRLTVNQMVDLAMGKAAGRIGKEVMDLVLRGKTVDVLEYEYKKYLCTAPEALLRHYESLESTLKDFGIKGFEKKDTGALRLRKKVLTQKDMNIAVQQSKKLVQVPKDTCITPLAREFARDHHIRIQRI